MKKKLLALGLAATMAAATASAFVGCGANEDFKVGFIFLHDQESTYDKNFIDAAEEARKELGLSKRQFIKMTNISEDGTDCYDAAVTLINQGCDIIFADSFGHEPNMIEAAKKYPDVQFCHATGVKAHTENLANYHNAFASIYEGRYLAGVAAGQTLLEKYDANNDGAISNAEAKVGYVGAFNYAEVISGYTSWFLGVRSVVPNATMAVRYTNSWYDIDKENAAAATLINTDKCKLISQHADSMGAPNACESKNIPNVSYNGLTKKTTNVASSKINWAPYFVYIVNQVKAGKEIATDWTGTIETGSVIVDLPSTASEAVKAKVEAAKKALADGTLKVFDTKKFTVGGETLTSYLADVDDDGTYTGETEAIKNGVFEESVHRSAPYFNIIIDGITEVK